MELSSQSSSSSSRKRSLPSSRQRNGAARSHQGLGASAATTTAATMGLILSVAIVTGFQHNQIIPTRTTTTTATLPFLHHQHPHPFYRQPHRFATILKVLTDPTRLAPSSTKTKKAPSTTATKKKAKSANSRVVTVDRAALEELYALQSALEKLQNSKRLLQSSLVDLEDSKRIDGGMSFLLDDNVDYEDDEEDANEINSDVGASNTDSIPTNAAPPLTTPIAPSGMTPSSSPRQNKAKTETKPTPKKKSVKRSGHVVIRRSFPLSSSSTTTSSTPSKLAGSSVLKEETLVHQLQERSGASANSSMGNKFPGLTVNPKRKNRKKRKSLTTVPPTYRNPYLYPIPDEALGTTQAELYRMMMEEDLVGSEEVDDGLLLDVTATDMLDYGEELLSLEPVDMKRVAGRTSISSRSSTMQGYGEKSMSHRQKAYNDGIKLVEQRSGQKLIESAEAKAKRKNYNGAYMYKNSASVPDSLVRFANEIHVVDRITAKEEKELGAKTQEAIKLQAIYDRLQHKLAREPTDDEWCAAAGKINMEAISEAIEEGLEAKNRLVMSNLRMVQGVVNVYIRNGLQGSYNSGDLMQEGIMALIRAAEKFDPSRGFRFSTYAMYWIRSAIKRDHTYQSRVVQVPQRMHDDHKRLIRAQAGLRESLKRNPTKSELAEATGLKDFQIDRVMEAVRQETVSFDQSLVNQVTKSTDNDSKDTLYSIVASKVDVGEYENAVHRHLRDDLMSTLNQHLTEEQVRVLMLRFGLEHGDSTKCLSNKSGLRTFAEVARLSGLKPDKVRRLIQQGLQHLQSVMGDEWNDYQLELSQ